MVSPEKGAIGPMGRLEAEVVWAPQPGCTTSETLVLKASKQQEPIDRLEQDVSDSVCLSCYNMAELLVGKVLRNMHVCMGEELG